MNHPNPTTTNPADLADWIFKERDRSLVFIFTDEENKLIRDIRDGAYTGAPNCAQDLHELRILFWQLVGAIRGLEMAYA